ncbi:MAG TPA: hypothetical protein VK074_05300, partial [Fodinibius sp.]|nr:hypothetical protein [Fodinibius sp.]
PSDYLSIQAGLALKETFVMNDSLSTDYGLVPGDNFRFEPGYSLGITFEKEIMTNVKLMSSIETFTNLQRHIDRTDVIFSNELVGKINDFLNMSLQFVTIYDDDFSSKLQVKQVLSAGLSVTFI